MRHAGLLACVLAAPLAAQDGAAALDSAALGALSSAQERFAAALYLALPARAEGGNLVCSPWGALRVLAMSGAGARGATLAEHAAALGFDPALEPSQLGLAELERALDRPGTGPSPAPGLPRPTAGDQVRAAGAVWSQRGEPLAPGWSGLLERAWGRAPEALDLAGDPAGSAARINAWVAARTAGKIPGLVPPEGIPGASLILGHAVHLEAGWLAPFDPALTREGEFQLEGGGVVRAPLMRMEDARLPAVGGEGWVAVELPYQGQRLSCVVVVPDAGRFAAVEADLGRVLPAVLRGLPARARSSITLVLPRFAIDSRHDLLPALGPLGIHTAAVPDQADFSGIDGRRGLFVQAFLQGAFIEVDETGTRAGAATLQSMARSGPTEVLAVRPFLFLIRDRDLGTVLFLGRVMDPTGAGTAAGGGGALALAGGARAPLLGAAGAIPLLALGGLLLRRARARSVGHTARA